VSKIKPIRTALALLCVGTMALSSDQKGPWRLREVLKLAADRVDDEDNSVQNARLELQMLETLSRTRVEFRPQLNVLAFANPIFLAANLAAGFSVNHRTAPSPATLELARFAVVEAEVGHARRRIDAQIDTTRQFLALAESQDVAGRTCNGLGVRSRDGKKVNALLSLKRITKLDAIRFEQEVTGLESDCLEAKAQAETAAVALKRLVGVDLPLQEVQIATDDLIQFSDSSELPGSKELVKTVFESQGELRLISQHMSNFTAPQDRKFQVESVANGYAYLGNKQKSFSGVMKDVLLSGNPGGQDGEFLISFRNTGDRNATYAFLQARLVRLEHEFDELKRTVAGQIEDNEQRVTLAANRLHLAQKKQLLADELQEATAQRVRVGLQGAADELWASRDAARAEAEYAHLQLEWKRSFFTVVALCDPQKLDASALLARAGNASYSKATATKEPPVSSIRAPQQTGSIGLTAPTTIHLALENQSK
jgi:hypothetical protein